MGVSRLLKNFVSREKRKKRVIKLPKTYFKDYSLCESAYKALIIIAEIEKKPKKRTLDKIIIWFYKGYYRTNGSYKAKLFTQNNPNIKSDEIWYYKKNHITERANV